jgi:hypothetical protein
MATVHVNGRHPSALPRTPGVSQHQVGDGAPAIPPVDIGADAADTAVQPTAQSASSTSDTVRDLAVRNEVESALYFVMNVSGLAQWIERARALCEGVSFVAEATPEIAQRLRAWNIAYSGTDWDEVASAGLRELHMAIERRARDALVALTGEAPR